MRMQAMQSLRRCALISRKQAAFSSPASGGCSDLIATAHSRRMWRRDEVRVAMAQVPVCECGASTGFDCGESFARSQMLSSTTASTERNSLCQFWNDSNQNFVSPR